MHKIYLYVTSKCEDAVIRRLYVVAIPYFIGEIPQMYFPTIMNYEL